MIGSKANKYRDMTNYGIETKIIQRRAYQHHYQFNEVIKKLELTGWKTHKKIDQNTFELVKIKGI
jgi:hypothetical protein